MASQKWVCKITGKETAMMESILDVENEFPGVEFKRYIHVSKLGINPDLYNSYEACPDSVKQVIDKLEVNSDDSFVDIGCGKGYVMFVVARKQFSRIDGIEICPQLAKIAAHNLAAVFGKSDSRFHIFVEDAAQFDGWDNYTFAFMYNPFKKACMDSVIKNIGNSLSRVPRRFSLLYYNPVLDEIIWNSGIFSHKSIFSEDCIIYSND